MSCSSIHLAAKASAGSEGWRAAAISVPVFCKETLRNTEAGCLVSILSLQETWAKWSVHAGP